MEQGRQRPCRPAERRGRRHPYDRHDRRLSDLIRELSIRSDEFVSGVPPRTSRSTAPASSSSTTRSSATSTCRSSPSNWPADPSQMLLTYTAEPGSPSQYAPASPGPAGPRPPTASSRPPRLIPRSRLNRSGGLTDMGNNLKVARGGVLGGGRSLSSWAESPSTSVSRSIATQAPRHRARR
jgi:hypothetical protein